MPRAKKKEKQMPMNKYNYGKINKIHNPIKNKRDHDGT
jgi:hypothetical protein